MKRLKFWTGGVLVALATAGIAVAQDNGAQTQTVSATFSAEAKRVLTRTCNGSDGKYTITRGIYVGSIASSDDRRLNGRLRLNIHSVYNEDEDAGWMSGIVHIRNEDADTRAVARLKAVNVDGNVEGLLVGAAGGPRVHLLANFSAGFSADAFTNGMLGTGGSANAALVYSGHCKKRDDAQARHEEKKQRPEGAKNRPEGEKSKEEPGR